jgi:7-keto-8-aminopelargonate synthetase-like enzyme
MDIVTSCERPDLKGEADYVTLAAYPLVPRAEVGFRIQVTAANGDDEIDELCATLHRLCDRFELARNGD